MPACRTGATGTRPSAMATASMPATTMATAFARSTSTRPRASGPCCVPGSGRTVASRRRSCRPISASSSSSTTLVAGARRSSAPSLQAWSPRPMLTTPKPDKSLAFLQLGDLNATIEYGQPPGIDDVGRVADIAPDDDLVAHLKVAALEALGLVGGEHRNVVTERDV